MEDLGEGGVEFEEGNVETAAEGRLYTATDGRMVDIAVEVELNSVVEGRSAAG